MKRMITAYFCIFLYAICADAGQPPWMPITGKSNSLTILGQVFDRYGSPIQEEGYVIAAFNSDNVCLGMANISKNGTKWEFALAVSFDDDDQAVFKLWDGITEKIYDLPEKIELSKQTRYENKIFGQPVSVSPKVGVIGRDMDITISGGGFFDADTKVFLEFDAGNRGSVISSLDIQGENNIGYAENLKIAGHTAYVAAGFGLQIVDISNPLRPVLKGSVRADGFADEIEIVGNTAYVTNKDKGVQIVDVSDPEKPRQTGFIEIADSVNKVIVIDRTAYVATGTKGLQIIDVSDPAKPVVVGFYNPESATSVHDVSVVGNIAYITISNNIWFTAFTISWKDSFITTAHFDLKFIDTYTSLSRRDSFELVGILDRLYGWDNLERVDNFYNVQLQILDISNPQNPSKLSSISLDNKKIVVTNGIVYSISENSYGDNTMNIIDVSDPLKPNIAGSIDIHGYPTNIIKNKDKLYMTTQNGGLQVIDIKDPLHPIIAFYVDNDAYADAKSVGIINDIHYKQNGVEIIKDIAVIAYNKAQNGKKTGYLEIVDLTYSSGFNKGCFTDTDGSAYAVAIHQNKAYVTYGDWNQGGVDIIDISNPSASKIISHAALPQKGDDIVISGDFAYVLCGNDLQILDIRNSEKAVIIGSLTIPMTVRKIAVSQDGRTIYAAVWKSEKEIKNESGKVIALEQTGGLQMIDVSNPEKPVPADFFNTSSDPKGIVVSEDRIYLSYNTYYPDFTYGCWFILYGSTDCYTRSPKSGIHIIDISNPSDPLIVGDIKLDKDDSVDDIAINGNYLYLLSRTTGISESYFSIIDTSNPAEPKWIGSVKSPALSYTSGKIALSGNIAFVVGYEGNISQIFDVSDPSNPSLVAITDVIGTPQGLASDKGWVYLTYGNRGLFSFAIPTLSNNLQMSDDSNISLTIPKPEIAGNYTLRILSGENTYVIPGAITIVPENDDLLHAKAIIVAGYLSETDSLLPETKMAADYAKETLLKQGYSEENIYYLRSDKDSFADLNHLEDRIKVWASDASDLLIYIVDHGGDKTFYLNPEEPLIKEKLNEWLTVLQDKMKGRLIIIYDACMSGSFIPLANSSDRKPIIITSTKPDEKAHFLPRVAFYPPQSFSYHFWTSVSRYGGRIWDAFTIGKDKMNYLQTPLVDTDGDGIGNETNDLETIKGAIIGRGVKMQSRGSESIVFPEIKTVSPEQNLNGETNAAFWAETDRSDYHVWMLIVPPEIQQQSSDTPIIELPRAELRYNSNNGRYEGAYNNFFQKGTYKVNIYAIDSAGNSASPKQTFVIQTKNLMKADLNDDGIANLADVIMVLQILSGTDAKIRSDYTESETDVNGDNRVGIEEAIYILQNISKLR